MLTLEVIGEKAANMGRAARKLFEGGGTIGRLRDNDWVFPDEHISGHHAKIIFQGGRYMIEDTSTNGVFVNSLQNRLTRGQPHALRHGDTLFIDDYEVRVSMEEGAELERTPPRAPSANQARLIPHNPFDEISLSATEDTDPLQLLGLQDRPALPSGPSAAGLAGNSPLSHHYRPPPAVAPPPRHAGAAAGPAAGLIPDDYDPLASDEFPAPPRSSPRSIPVAPTAPVSPAAAPAAAVDPSSGAAPSGAAAAARGGAMGPSGRPVPRTPAPNLVPVSTPVPLPAATVAARPEPPPSTPVSPVPPPSPGPRGAPGRNQPEPVAAGAGNVDFVSLLAAAGIETDRVSPQLSQYFGQILRVVVAGVMDLIRVREKTKNEFRMRMTTFKQADNNPLKFSANVEDALHNLLVKRNPAYLGPVEAFEDAFNEVRNHQMAVLAGMRVAYDAMLAEFDPARLQEQFDQKAKGGSLLGGSAKGKYWELYRTRYHDMVRDADSSFRHLFGDEFAKAYEEQMARLKTLGRSERRAE